MMGGTMEASTNDRQMASAGLLAEEKNSRIMPSSRDEKR